MVDSRRRSVLWGCPPGRDVQRGSRARADWSSPASAPRAGNSHVGQRDHDRRLVPYTSPSCPSGESGVAVVAVASMKRHVTTPGHADPVATRATDDALGNLGRRTWAVRARGSRSSGVRSGRVVVAARDAMPARDLARLASSRSRCVRPPRGCSPHDAPQRLSERASWPVSPVSVRAVGASRWSGDLDLLVLGVAVETDDLEAGPAVVPGSSRWTFAVARTTRRRDPDRPRDSDRGRCGSCAGSSTRQARMTGVHLASRHRACHLVENDARVHVPASLRARTIRSGRATRRKVRSVPRSSDLAWTPPKRDTARNRPVEARATDFTE